MSGQSTTLLGFEWPEGMSPERIAVPVQQQRRVMEVE
jgi:hypothetical protein